jgi:hypothetical protein
MLVASVSIRMASKPKYHVIDISDFVPPCVRWWGLPSSLRNLILLAGELVVLALKVPPGLTPPASLRCRRRPGRKRCAGFILVHRQDVPPQIHWRCPECEDAGVLTNWNRSPWIIPATPQFTAWLSAKEVAALLASQQLYSSSIPVIQRGPIKDKMLEIEGTLEDLEWLLGCALTTANPALSRLAKCLPAVVGGHEPSAETVAIAEALLHPYGMHKPASRRGDWYDLRIQLLHIQPPIWRRIRVAAGLTLHELHLVLQLAMGWTESHLYVFEFGERRFSVPDDEWEFEMHDSTSTTLASCIRSTGDALVYEYDLGDSWRHRVTLVESARDDSESARLSCLDGARACPPEDAGGPPGYEELVRVMRDPSHERHAELIEWVGGRYDPESFDLARHDQLLARLDRRWWPRR